MMASELARVAIQRLLQEVVAPMVINDREGVLTDDKCSKIKQNKLIDTRRSPWCIRSAKGGAGFSKSYRNVSLIDHCLSVATGAVVLCAPKLADDGVEEEDFRRLCFTVALVGLFHDLNKRIGCHELQSHKVRQQLEEYWQILNLDSVLERYGIIVSVEQMHQLLCFVESGTAYALGGYDTDGRLRFLVKNYVRLADALDSAWHRLPVPENNGKPCGIRGVLDVIKDRTELLATDFQQWRHIQLSAPQLPFLLDELLRALSSCCYSHTGFPPLVESHHDGRLDVLVPEQHAEAILGSSFSLLTKWLSPQVEIVISTAKTPQIKGGAPSLEELVMVLKENSQYIALLLPLSLADQDILTSDHPVLEGRFVLEGTPTKGQTFNLLVPDNADPSYKVATIAALVRLFVSMPGGSSKSYIPQRDRLKQLETFFATEDSVPLPECTNITRQTLLAVAVANRAAEAPEYRRQLLELLNQWYEGAENYKGIREHLAGDESSTLQEALEGLEKLLKGQLLAAGTHGEFTTQSCLVTGLPGKGRIEASDALYGIKISAFSTRRGRPAVLGDAKGKTYISPLAFIEYQLRSRERGSSTGDYPLLISSPTMTGLFAGFRLVGEQYVKFGLYDLAREQIEKGDVLKGPEIFQHRLRLARYENLPPRFADQIGFLKRAINAVLRTGRPFHIFRGLPEQRAEIFYIDCLPFSLHKLFGKKQGFGLEDLPLLDRKLSLVESLLECISGGQILVREMLSQSHQFGALCVAWMAIEDEIQANLKKNKHMAIGRYRSAQALLDEFIQEARLIMSEPQRNILELAKKAAELQKAVGIQSSKREQQLIFQLCIDTAKGCSANGIAERDSLIRAIEGALENKILSRRYGGAKEHREGKDTLTCCEDIAIFFVENIWLKQLGGKQPGRRVRSYMLDIYRMELLHIYRDRRANRLPTGAI